jgi:secondary thiamine-phosphate synthase enzyme
MVQLTVQTPGQTAVVDITERVSDALPANATGTATVFVRHTTAGVTVNEPEARLRGDLAAGLDDLVPDEGWAHDELDDNADSHVRAMLVGPSETIPVADGAFELGTWQAVLLVECDGPRERTLDIRW